MVDVGTRAVYAIGSAQNAASGVVNVPLQIADPVPIHADKLVVEYVANVVDQGLELRHPMTFMMSEKPRSSHKRFNNNYNSENDPIAFCGQGQIYHWTVSDCGRFPLISETFVDVYGNCVQTLDEGGQRVTPVAGVLDKLTVSARSPLRATVWVNNASTQLTLDCMHQTTQTEESRYIMLKPGDKFGLQLSESSGGDFAYASIAVRFREV